MSTFVKTGTNVVYDDGANEYKFSSSVAIKKLASGGNDLEIIDPILGLITVDWNNVTAPVVISRDALFTELITNFF